MLLTTASPSTRFVSGRHRVDGQRQHRLYCDIAQRIRQPRIQRARCPRANASGWQIKDVRFLYDPITDKAYFGR